MMEESGHMNRNTYLYLSHFLSTWNSRVFEFGAVLFVASAFPRSLLQTSIYALARALSAILFSPLVGKYIDRNDRLHVVRLSILSQRAVVAISCIIIYFLLTKQAWPMSLRWICLAMISLLACVEKLSAIMNLVSVERDWVVVISANDDDILSTMNAQMRRIDLICKLIGPLAIALLAGYSMVLGIFIILGLNVVSVVVEYFTIANVYYSVPALQESKLTSQDGENAGEQEPLLQSDTREDNEALTNGSKSYLKSVQTYVRSPMFLPSVSLSLLYLTVLSFNGQMVTYLLSLPPIPRIDIPINPAVIGILRTFSVISEISATFLSPLLMSRIGPIRSGLWAINEQVFSLLIGTTLFLHFLKQGGGEASSIAFIPLVISVILSRMGLWSFDLSVQLQIQQIVPHTQMGAFSTIETSLQSTFELLSYASTIVWSRPEQFRWPVIMSCSAVTCAAVLYARYVRERRGHLIHWGPCMDVKRDENEESGEQEV